MRNINQKILLGLLLVSTTISAGIFPADNEWKFELGKTSFNKYQALKVEAESEISPTISYGLTDKLFLNLNYLTYEDSLADPNETIKTSLGLNYNVYSTNLFTIFTNAGVSLIDTEFSDQDESGTSFYFETQAYLKLNQYINPFIGLKYFSDPSADMDYKDNLLETAGLIFSPTQNWDISLAYELSNEAFTYGTSFYFSF